jgi:pre-mRNA-processing factor 17
MVHVELQYHTTLCMQEYNYHLAAVNTVTFVDTPIGNRFVSTSDDKTIRMWEFGIPVQVCELVEILMHVYFIGSQMPWAAIRKPCSEWGGV